jgi:hypothetical protein
VIAASLCRQLDPRHVVLLGNRTAGLARTLVDVTEASGGTLHIAGSGDNAALGALRQATGDRCIVHQGNATDVIGLLPVPDLLWVDADPNWHATFSILQAAAKQARRLGKPFPVTLVENTGWPYGRRESYDDPGAIPESMRHPHERAGLLPGQAAPGGASGLYADRYNGTQENAPGLGVLTAIEDFLELAEDQLRLIVLPGFGGLSALCPRNGAAAGAFGAQDLAAYALAIAQALDSALISQTLAVEAQRDATKRATARADALLAVARRQDGAPGSSPGRAPPSPATGALQIVRSRAGKLRHLAARAINRVRPRPDAAVSAEDKDADRLRQSPAFDADWYLQTYPDVAASGDDPVLHYLRNGAGELRDPGPSFSTSYYLSQYHDVAESGINPLLHYLACGATEGRNPAPNFDTARYLHEHPGLIERGENPLEHFVRKAS